jgi:hypothetical protein
MRLFTAGVLARDAVAANPDGAASPVREAEAEGSASKSSKFSDCWPAAMFWRALDAETSVSDLEGALAT